MESTSWANEPGPDQQCRPYGRHYAGPPQVMDVPKSIESAEVAYGSMVEVPVDRATLNFAEGYAYWPHVDKSSVLF